MSAFQFARRVEAVGQFHVGDPSVPELSDDDAHHLWRVLRAREGDEVVVTNGHGAWAFATLTDGHLARSSDVVIDEEPAPAELYLSPLKGDRSEWAVVKATELGVTRIVPLLSERVVIKWKTATSDKFLARWRRVAREASGQCRRSHDVVVDEPVSVADVPLHVAVADFDGTDTLDGVRAIAIGPEGGWAPNEFDDRFTRVGLGTTVLRGDTAAVAAATLLVQRRPGWSRHAGGQAVGNDGETR